jgi:ribonucleoside-triphosphate reductase, adenosylcobalamin-dependent
MDVINKVILSDEFVDEVKKTIKPHWGELGWVTYKRTYARYIDELGRTENWSETVKRVVEGNINLDPRLKNDNLTDEQYAGLVKEAQNLYKLVYGLAATPSGRNLWISGTEYQHRNGDALNNCWFVAIRPQKYGDSHIVPSYLQKDQLAVSMPFSFMFDQLMKGGGVGFSVVPSNMKLMPVVDNKVDLTVIIGKESASYKDAIAAGAVDREDWLAKHDISDTRHYELPDTREGWVIGNANMIDAHFNDTNDGFKDVVLDITDIRAKGEKIKGFGGTASGPVPLVEMFFDINEVLNNAVGRKLTSVDCTDMGNLIGKTVVAGNVRRSAELALGGATDDDFITMKQDQKKLYHHRWASNNSVAVDSEFKRYAPIADSITHNGEPGIVNLELSRNYGRVN